MILKEDIQDFASYLEDTSNIKGKASALVIPESQENLVEFIRTAAQKSMPLTLSAGRTGTTGGCVPLEGVVVSLERLSRIIDIHRDEKRNEYWVRLESGVRLSSLYEEIKKYSLFYPPDPTEPQAFIGGTISTCASGSNSFKYGTTRRWVKRLKILLASGQIVDIPRGKYFFRKKRFRFRVDNTDLDLRLPSYSVNLPKNSAGYFSQDNMDLIDLFIGQEGTLGAILEAEIRLKVERNGIISFLAFFDSQEECLNFLIDLRKRALSVKEYANDDVFPECLEFFDRNSLGILRNDFPHIPRDSQAALFFEQRLEASSQHCLQRYIDILERFSVSLDNIWFSEKEQERAKLKEFRHRLPELLNEEFRRLKVEKYSTDIAVPWKRFFEMFSFYKEHLSSSKLRYVIFGHIGDAHLHINILPENAAQSRKARALLRDFSRFAVELGGTISAEHGIGKLKRKYLTLMYNQKEILQMANLKKSLDKYCILNLDNIFSKDYLLKVK